MKFLLLIGLLSCGAAGCAHIDLTPAGDPMRVLAGEVRLSDGRDLPADAVVTVRVVDSALVGQAPTVYGTQTITAAGPGPIPYRVEYTAEDELLRHGLNVEVRVSFGGRVRYYNVNKHAVTLSTVSDTHVITVDPTRP
jgi:uncharacterized lipoprotein YbaY